MARRMAIRMIVMAAFAAAAAWIFIWMGILPEPPPCPVNQLLSRDRPVRTI